MKKIFCKLNIFDLEQKIYIIDTEANTKDIVAIASIEELPATIAAISAEMNVSNIVLSGNFTYNSLLGKNIIAYSKLNYNTNEINVEVIE